MRIHAFAAALAILIVLAFYELVAIAVGDFPATITALVSSSDPTTALAVAATLSLAIALVAHFVYERIQRRRGR